jgi:hypothetical protein
VSRNCPKAKCLELPIVPSDGPRQRASTWSSANSTLTGTALSWPLKARHRQTRSTTLALRHSSNKPPSAFLLLLRRGRVTALWRLWKDGFALRLALRSKCDVKQSRPRLAGAFLFWRRSGRRERSRRLHLIAANVAEFRWPSNKVSFPPFSLFRR